MAYGLSTASCHLLDMRERKIMNEESGAWKGEERRLEERRDQKRKEMFRIWLALILFPVLKRLEVCPGMTVER